MLGLATISMEKKKMSTKTIYIFSSFQNIAYLKLLLKKKRVIIHQEMSKCNKKKNAIITTSNNSSRGCNNVFVLLVSKTHHGLVHDIDPDLSKLMHAAHHEHRLRTCVCVSVCRKTCLLQDTGLSHILSLCATIIYHKQPLMLA